MLPGRLLLGAEWNGLVLGEESGGAREMGLGGGYGTLAVGYAIPISPRVRVYPRVGVGAGGFGLSIENDEQPVGFDDVLADPDAHVELDGDGDLSLTRDGPVLDLGAGAELLPGGWGRGLVIGLRAGWLVAPFDSSWSLEGRAVSGGPDASIGGPYVRVTFGGGPRW
jgi:hypothetical protein